MKLNNEELLKFHCSLNIRRLIKSHMMRWAEHVACISDIIDAYKITCRKTERYTLNTTKFPVHVIMNIVMIHWVS
jgi:hypothetical protein